MSNKETVYIPKQGLYSYKVAETGDIYSNTVTVAASGPCSSAVKNSIPATPVLTATPSSVCGRVVLNWNPVPGATSFNIYKLVTFGDMSAFLLSATTTTPRLNVYDDPAPLGINLYKVSAVNSKGESSQSSQASATVTCSGGGGKGGKIIAPPSAPSLPTAGTIINNTLSWSSVSGANGYNIYRSLDGGTSYSFVASTTAVSFIDVQQSQGTYTYKVSAVTSAGESSKSTPVGVNVSVSYTQPAAVASNHSFLGSLLGNVWTAFMSLFK